MSDAFRSAPQLAAFLTFVVEKALAGEAQEIKGYTIATQALGRDPSFDPQADPIVRVEAGRLRRALDAYYANAGRNDRLKVAIPRGTYVPVFERAPEPEAGPAPQPADEPETLQPERFDPSAVEAPALAVSPEIPLAPEPAPAPEPPPAPEPLHALPPEPAAAPAEPAPEAASAAPQARTRFHRRGWQAAAALAGLLLLAGLLAWLAGMAAGPSRPPAAAETRPVVLVEGVELAGPVPPGFSPTLLRSTVLDALARFEEVAVVDATRSTDGPSQAGRYLLNLRLSAGREVMARLTHEGSGKVIWARRFDGNARLDPREIPESDIARQIAVTVGQPYGVLFADLLGRPGLPDRVRCTLQAYDYWNAPTPDRHRESRACLEGVVAAEPRAATAWANLTYFYLDEHRSSYNPRPEPLERALQAARRAVAVAPESPRANQALMGAYFTRGEIEQALRYGERARELNPFDADVLADVGARHVQAGRYREGAALIERAAAINAADPPWYDFFLFLAAYMQGDREAARAAAARITSEDYGLGLVARIIAAGEAGDAAKARELAGRLVTLQPEYGRDPRAALKRRWFVPEIYDRLVAGLVAAGLKG